MTGRTLKSLGVYAATAGLALLFASWVSSQFMTRAASQTVGLTPTTTGAPAPDAAAASNPASSNPAASANAAGSSNAAPGGSPSAAGTIPPVIESLSSKKNPLADIIEDYNYSPKDKRDPFVPFERPHGTEGMVGPLWPLQGFDLDQLHLVGIIWDVKNPKAMIMDPSGKGYVVKINERIGRNNGFIARIREGEVVVVESVVGIDGKLAYTTKLIKLQQTNSN